jgi:NAD(P)-dependent dehydrogenase (short-subunit alcohol dehydrogenase family)
MRAGTGKRTLAAGALMLAMLASVSARAATVLITGANSGIGLEFAKQYAAAGWTVIATHRHSKAPDTLVDLQRRYPEVRIEEMDVTSAEQVRALSAKLKDVSIDVLLNNAGIYNEDGAWSSQDFGRLDYALYDTMLAVNVKGPLLVTEAFAGQVKASHQKKIVSISSTIASLTQPMAGTRGIFYAASKAALNREMLLVAEVLKPDGVTVVLLHPGSVRTERQSNAPYKNMIETNVSIRYMIKTIGAITLKDTGHFMLYDGTASPW